VYFGENAALLTGMSPADGVDKVPKISPDPSAGSLRPSDLKKLPKSAEEYVMIENRLAAQREKPKAGSPLDSIFNQLRDRLSK
jgi:hypothetical protein